MARDEGSDCSPALARSKVQRRSNFNRDQSHTVKVDETAVKSSCRMNAELHCLLCVGDASVGQISGSGQSAASHLPWLAIRSRRLLRIKKKQTRRNFHRPSFNSLLSVSQLHRSVRLRLYSLGPILHHIPHALPQYCTIMLHYTATTAMQKGSFRYTAR